MTRGMGEFEQLLLFAILRLGDNAYGVSIRREIASQTGKDVAAGAVYTGLDRLRARGFVSSRDAETTPSRGGRRRRYYRLEPAGAVALEASYTKVRAMASGMLDALREAASGALPGAGG